MDGNNCERASCFTSGERQKLVMSIIKNVAGVDLDLYSQGVVQVPVPMADGPMYNDPQAEKLSAHVGQVSQHKEKESEHIF